MGVPASLPEDVVPGTLAWGDALSRERALLGAILAEPELCVDVCRFVAAEDFSTSLHSRLFDALSKANSIASPDASRVLATDLGVYAWDAPGGVAKSFEAMREERVGAEEAQAIAREIHRAAVTRGSRPEPIDLDVAAWSHQQANLLAQLAKRSDALSRQIDWQSVIEEVLYVGRSQTRAVVRKMEIVFEHLLKLASDPDAPSRNRWRIEIEAWRRQIADDAAPSMRQLIDLDAAWRKGRDDAVADLADYAAPLAPGTPDACPYTFEELTAKNSTMADLLRLFVDRMNPKSQSNS